MADDYRWSEIIGTSIVSEIANDGSVVLYEVVTKKQYKCQLHSEHIGSVIDAVRAYVGDRSLVVPVMIIEAAFLKCVAENCGWYGMWQHRPDCPMVLDIARTMGLTPKDKAER